MNNFICKILTTLGRYYLVQLPKKKNKYEGFTGRKAKMCYYKTLPNFAKLFQ